MASSTVLDDLEALIPELAGKATRAAYNRAIATGRPVAISDGQNIVEVDKRGHRKVIKKIAPAKRVRPGTKIKLP
jgi:hypothetical protein